MKMVLKTVFVGETVQHGSHPRRETLHFPHAAQTSVGIAIQGFARARPVELDQGARQNANIGHGEVQSFRAGGRYDVRGVAQQKQLAVAHGLGDEAAHRRDAFLQHGAVGECPAVARRHARAQFGPDAVVGPLGDILFGIAL